MTESSPAFGILDIGAEDPSCEDRVSQTCGETFPPVARFIRLENFYDVFTSPLHVTALEGIPIEGWQRLAVDI
jgi:hypothetical protein